MKVGTINLTSTSLTNLGKLGSQLSFVLGMSSKVTNNDIVQRRDQDNSLHWELSYSQNIKD